MATRFYFYFDFDIFLLYDSSICSKIIGCGQIECDHDKNNLTQLRFYDLTDVCDRIVMIVHVMVLAEMCHRLSKNFPPEKEFFKLFCSQGDTIERTRNGKHLIYIKMNWKNMI